MKRLLLVDDMKGVRDSLEVILSPHYHVEVVKSARAALERVQGASYDLLITDIIMPEMDGNELMVEVRKRSSMRILAISAGGNGASASQALMLASEQADGVLEKPFSKAELLEKIEEMLS